MTTARSTLATASVALLAWLGASAALGSAPASQDAGADVPTTATVVVEAPAGALRPRAADVREATTMARRLAPGATIRTVVVTGASEAQSTVSQLAGADPDGVIVGSGPDLAPAIAAAQEAAPALRAGVSR